jgi:hypothetical protein
MPMQSHALQRNGTSIPISSLPLLPPAGELGRRKEKKLKPAMGFPYGPRFTCPVDTLLTVLDCILTKEEKRTWRSGPPQPGEGGKPAAGSDVARAVATASNAWRALLRALTPQKKRGDARSAKRIWYKCMVRQQHKQQEHDVSPLQVGLLPDHAVSPLQMGILPHHALVPDALGLPNVTVTPLPMARQQHKLQACDASPSQMGTRPRDKSTTDVKPPPTAIECRCRCRCEACLAGRCTACPTCGCDTARLIGHCFGLAEQFFHHLLPDSLPTSSFHLTTRPEWRCTACPYRYSGQFSQMHVPLLLTSEDIDALLSSGVEAEVGALVAAHLGASPYDYGACPQCGDGQLRSRPIEPAFPSLLLVEIGRPAPGGTGVRTDRVPWRLGLSPRMNLHVAGREAAYHAVALVYNDNDHWWADVLSGVHFRSDAPAPGSYRYDGLEAGGALRYTGRGPAIARTSEPRHMSLVWYRMVPTTTA